MKGTPNPFSAFNSNEHPEIPLTARIHLNLGPKDNAPFTLSLLPKLDQSLWIAQK